jgi:hypothetical protein
MSLFFVELELFFLIYLLFKGLLPSNLIKCYGTKKKYAKGINFKVIKNTLYLDDYNDNVLTDMLVKPTIISDVEDMLCSWVNEYVLALAKELLEKSGIILMLMVILILETMLNY